MKYSWQINKIQLIVGWWRSCIIGGFFFRNKTFYNYLKGHHNVMIICFANVRWTALFFHPECEHVFFENCNRAHTRRVILKIIHSVARGLYTNTCTVKEPKRYRTQIRFDSLTINICFVRIINCSFEKNYASVYTGTRLFYVNRFTSITNQ